MRAEIIAVGTELLLGQVVNTNATYLSESLTELGFEIYYHTVVGDNPKRLEEMIQLADQRSDLVVLCGGLGPTDDDLTKDVVAAHVQEPLVQDAEGLAHLESFFAAGKRQMTENNLRQVLTIQNGITLQNPTGLALGCLYQGVSASYLLLPGPPSEMKPMFAQMAAPVLREVFPAREKLYSRVLRFFGIGESALVTELADLIEAQTNPTLAPYAKPNEVTLRITAKEADEAQALQLIDEMEQVIQARVGKFFYGYGDDNSLAKVVVELLKAKGKTVTAAESLTAGEFQAALGDIPGVSTVFKGGFVTYSPETKVKFLGLDPEKLAEVGTVSEYCATAMAESALQLADSDFAVSFTGVAGPDELENQRPGTVWIALAQKNQPTVATKYHFTRDRSYVRNSAVMRGLDLIRRAAL
ncbi:competence/damage-inducible protein A [Enterococcus sp. LJL120]